MFYFCGLREAAKAVVAEKAVESVGDAIGDIALNDQAAGKLSPDEGNTNEEDEVRKDIDGGSALFLRILGIDTIARTFKFFSIHTNIPRLT